MGLLVAQVCSLVFDKDIARALSIFELLRGTKVTRAVLRETGVGVELNRKAWKKNKSAPLAAESQELVSKWREVARSEIYATRAATAVDEFERPIPSPVRKNA